MAADAENFGFNELHAELTFRHQENFVLHKHQSRSERRFSTTQLKTLI